MTDRQPLLENIEEQAVDDVPKTSGDNRDQDTGDGDDREKGLRNEENGENCDNQETGENGGEDGDGGDDSELDKSYHGILALTEIGIRDSREMIHTPLGLGRYLHQCSCKDIFFGVVATLCFLAVMTITIMRLAIFDLFGSADITCAIAVMMNLCFLMYYVYSGVFFERPYEIACAVFSMGFSWILLVINYALSTQGFYKMVRLIVASAMGPLVCVVGLMIIRSNLITNSVVFRICGSNKMMQARCTELFKYLALIKVDFQLGLTLAILMLKDGFHLGVVEWVFLIVITGLAAASAVLGYLMVRYEHGRMTLAFCILWFVLPGCCIYLIVRAAIIVQKEGHSIEQVGLTATIFVGVIICLIIRVAVIYFVLKVFMNYGVGLRQKAFEGYIDDENRERRDPEDFLPWRGSDYRNYQNPRPTPRHRSVNTA